MMQTNVVIMVMAATLITDKLTMAFKCASCLNLPNTIRDLAPLVTMPDSDGEPGLVQGELGQGSVQQVGVTSVASSPECCGSVTPWKRKGIIYTKLF